MLKNIEIYFLYLLEDLIHQPCFNASRIIIKERNNKPKRRHKPYPLKNCHTLSFRRKCSNLV